MALTKVEQLQRKVKRLRIELDESDESFNDLVDRNARLEQDLAEAIGRNSDLRAMMSTMGWPTVAAEKARESLRAALKLIDEADREHYAAREAIRAEACKSDGESPGPC